MARDEQSTDAWTRALLGQLLMSIRMEGRGATTLEVFAFQHGLVPSDVRAVENGVRWPTDDIIRSYAQDARLGEARLRQLVVDLRSPDNDDVIRELARVVIHRRYGHETVHVVFDGSSEKHGPTSGDEIRSLWDLVFKTGQRARGSFPLFRMTPWLVVYWGVAFSVFLGAPDSLPPRAGAMSKVGPSEVKVNIVASVLVAFLAGDRKSTRLNSSHPRLSRMPSSA